MALRTLTEAQKTEIYEDMRQFLSDELDIPLADIKPDSKILEDLKGDSMIYLELVEEFKKRFEVNVEIRVIGLYFQRHPVYTVKEVSRAIIDIVERGDELVKIAQKEQTVEPVAN